MSDDDHPEDNDNSNDTTDRHDDITHNTEHLSTSCLSTEECHHE